MPIAMSFESHHSNNIKPAFEKPSALLLFLFESHSKRPSLIAKYQYWPTHSLPHPFVQKRASWAETDTAGPIVTV